MNDNVHKMPPVPPFVKFVASAVPMVFDDSLSYYEALCALWKYISGMTDVINNNATLEEEYIEKFNELKEFVDHYFDNLDVQEEINNKLDEMADDGTLQSLIYNAINVPQGMTLDARRIGRKLFYSTDYPFNMQGGCRISDTLVAYALWDSITKYPVSNRIVIMNSTTGQIVRYANYSFGWCNSMTYYDGKLYIAERGKETDSEGTTQNNGIIHVLDVDTLSVQDTITMSFNVNAISFYDGSFYLLQENSNTVYKYDSTLATLEDTITLDIDYVNYHQDICVDGQYIYVLSTKPSNALNIFDVTSGTRIRSYNISKYGGTYRIGELQWIDKIDDDGNLIIGSDVFSYNECIAQFFIMNYKKNIDSKNFDQIYGQYLQCDSTVDYYNPDGVEQPFTSINEALNTSISNMIIECNSKSYPYIYGSDIRFCRIQNAILTGGAWLQYGEYVLVDCKLNACINPSHNDCALFIRRGQYIIQRTEFDTTTDYAINDEGDSIIKITQPTFTNYGVSVFKGNHSTSEVFLNNGNNIPYIPRAYNTMFNLTADSLMEAYTTGSYNWSDYCSLSESQIEEIIKSCKSIQIGIEGLNKGDIEYITINNKRGDNSGYSLTDIVISSSQIDERVAKCSFNISKTKLQITLACCQRTNNGETVILPSPTKDQLITIKSVAFFDQRF